MYNICKYPPALQTPRQALNAAPSNHGRGGSGCVKIEYRTWTPIFDFSDVASHSECALPIVRPFFHFLFTELNAEHKL